MALCDSVGEGGHGRTEYQADCPVEPEQLWLEVRRRGTTNAGSRWRAMVGRPEDAALFAGRTEGAAALDFDDPGELSQWLEAAGVSPAAAVPSDWHPVVVFGCRLAHPS
ncbi:hypothetical protein [Sinomonas sp.]|uniref:hypothetical protein n=1 Tax=Sinomonas sp. TaxID=1914986 RepID=UPI002FE15148